MVALANAKLNEAHVPASAPDPAPGTSRSGEARPTIYASPFAADWSQ